MTTSRWIAFRAIAGAAALLLHALTAMPAQAHVEADGLIVTRAGAVVVKVWRGVVTGSITVPFGAQTPTFEVTLLRPDSTLFQPQPPDTVWLRSLNTAPGKARYDSTGTWAFRLRGLQPNSNGGILLRVWYLNHYDFTSPAIPYYVATSTDAGEDPQGILATIGPLPNPIRGSQSLSYTVVRPAMVDVELFGPDGRCIRSLAHGNRFPGTYQAALPAAGLPSATYFVRLRTATGDVTRKVTVLH